MKKLLFGAGLLIAATSAAAAQGYFPPGLYNYVGEPSAAPPIAYGYDPYATDRNWLYYRSSGPGRGNNEESQR
jgi:hypothetical protein